MSHSPSLAVAERGFDAWRRGDFDALEAIFAPEVEWRWFEPGDWDCHNRDDVMGTLRQRQAAGFAEGRLNFHDAGSDVVVVTAHPSEIGGPEWPDETSTVIRFHEGKVVSMVDYRAEAEALAAAQLSCGPHVPVGVIALRGSSARSTSFACAVGPSAAAISTSTNHRRGRGD